MGDVECAAADRACLVDRRAWVEGYVGYRGEVVSGEHHPPSAYTVDIAIPMPCSRHWRGVKPTQLTELTALTELSQRPLATPPLPQSLLLPLEAAHAC